MCTNYIDPMTIEPIPVSHLIPLDKGHFIYLILRSIGKCVTKVTKQDILESSGLFQVCARHKSRSEAAVHAMNSLFQHEVANAVLLVHA